jgi:uncharacterized protein (TIGR03083 family)
VTPDWTDLLATATDRFARLTVEADPEADVPSCPGWSVTDLVDHLGGVHQWARHAVVVGTPDGQPVSPAPGVDLASWYAGHATALREALAGDPAAEAWTFGTEQTAGWWRRRQVHETTMHTRDLLDAAGRVAEWDLDPDLAWDGVHEVATEFYPRQVRLGRSEPIPGTLRLVATDIAAGAAGVDPVDIGEAEPVVEVRGTAADLLVLLWKRRTSDDPAAAALLALPITP